LRISASRWLLLQEYLTMYGLLNVKFVQEISASSCIFICRWLFERSAWNYV